ncbi:uncharacterized protein LOC141900837 [Tubulanus polymorphus]|uniref:uncharacterized protein LOC141900837 n=1 Tax=Tubulanus polymorphus TaxID=672921 RepID=UPI003DA5892E
MSGHNASIHDADHASMDQSEAFYLFIMSATGIFLNLIIILICAIKSSMQRMTSAFLIHGCILDIVKCAYCIPFGMSILTHEPPEFCKFIGGSYIIVISAYIFNMICMVCSEAYNFADDQFGGSNTGNICCVIFGIVMIYIGSVILHLGPTIVGGSFQFNKILGQCVFDYGQTPAYVIYIMWVLVTTLSMGAICHYLWTFYKNVKNHNERRLTNIIRASMEQGTVPDEPRIPPHKVRKLVQDAMSRVRCFTIILVVFVISWYPLFIITIADPNFNFPPTMYIMMTLIAWSHGTFNPVIFLLVDNKLNVIRNLICRNCDKTPSVKENFPLMSPTFARTSSIQMFERVGCRLCHEGKSHNTNLCNGRLGNGGLVRNNSFCEIHTVSDC